MAKKVTAPKVYHPGGGHPPEHLAYLNEREMAYLARMNGGGASRGPKGLPSFVETSGTKTAGGMTDKYQSSGGSWNSSNATRTSSTNNSYGNTGRGAGSNYGPGSGRPGTSSAGTGAGGQNSGMRGAGSNYGPGSGRPGTSPAGTGSGGQRGAGSNYGPGSGRPGTSPPAGSGGQRGAGSNYGPGSGRPDQSVQQQSAIKDTANAVKNPSVNKDLRSGGINTINVGPMGTPVSVGPARMSPQNTPYDYGGALVSGLGSIANSIGSAAMSGINSLFGTGTPSAPPTKGANFPGAYDRVPGSVAGAAQFEPEPQVPTSDLKGPLDRPVITQDTINRMKEQYSQYKNPNAGYGPVEADLAARGARMEAIANAPDDAFQGYDNYDPLTSVSSNPTNRLAGTGYGTFNVTPDLRKNATFGSRLAGATTLPDDQERILEVEDVPPEIMNSYRQPSYPTIGESPRRGRIGAGPRGVMESLTGRSTYTPGDYDAYRNPETVSTKPSVDSPYIDPITQEPSYPEKTKTQKVAEYAGLPGKLLKGASFLGRKEFERLSPQEQADLMERWSRNNAEYLKGQSPTNDRGQLPPPPRRMREEPFNSGGGTKNETGRPQQYYNWDVGVNIPSPGDSDYTLYLKYLQEKAAAQAANGVV